MNRRSANEITKREIFSQYDFDSKMFPDADQRRSFLSSYLKHFNKLNNIKSTDEEFAAELETLFHQANLSALMFLGRLVMVGGLFDQNPDVSSYCLAFDFHTHST